MKRDRTRRPRKRVCSFCVDKATVIDYKDVNKLKKYVTERAKFYQDVFLVTVPNTKEY